MLTILKGGPGCGKSAWLLERIRERCARGERSLLLVPESGSHQAERRLLEVCGNRGGAFASVTTFSKLTEDVLRVTGCRTETLDAGGRVLTMHRALCKVQSGLEYYRRASRPQMTEKLTEAASELAACGITPEQLLAAESMSPKIRDIGLIYAQYRALCAESQLDPAARIELAGERLEESGLLAGAAVFIDGFEGFTAQKQHFLEKMLRCCTDMTVALLLGTDRTLYQEQRQTLDRLRRMAESCGCGFQQLDCPDVHRRRPEALENLADDLFDFRAKPKNKRKGLSLYTTDDINDECELAAAILRQQMLSGVRCREMAVVCGNLEEYGPLLSAAFEKYGVPLYLSQKTDLLQKPALAAALGGLTALEEGLTFASVLDWLRCGVGGFSRDAIDRLENYCYQWNIHGAAWFKPFVKPTCGYDNPRPDEALRLEQLEQTRAAVADYLLTLREELKASRDGDAYAEAMQRHLEKIGLRQQLEERCLRLKQQGRGRESAETAQLYQILQNALTQFAGAMKDVSMDRREFYKLLQLTLRQYDVSAIPPSLDSVQAVTFERLPSMPVRQMVIVGGREGLFPPEKPSESLLSEQERVELEGFGIELTQSAMERVWQQQCAVCRAIAVPQDGLTVTAPRRLADGTACSASFLMLRMGKLRGITEEDGKPLLESLRLTAKKPLFELACTAAEDGGFGVSKAALRAVRENERSRAYIEKLRNYADSPRGPIQSRELVQKLYGKKVRLTASRLERVSACHMSHFLQYGLKAKARREARFGAPEIGTFLHYVVEKAIPELCKDETVKPETLAEKYIDQYLKEHLPRGLDEARFRAIFRQTAALACRVVKNVWAEIQAGDFRPVCFELDFSAHGDLPPLELREGSLTLSVGGKVDRVDGYVLDDTLYLKVVDYKTGTKTFHLSDILYGLNLQMFLYLQMLMRANPQQVLRVTGRQASKIEPCGVLYIPAKDPYVQEAPGDTEAELEKKLEKELRRIGLVLKDPALLEAMEHGNTYHFLPVEKKRDETFTAASCIASAAELGRILRKTEAELREIARNISDGDVEATPYRSGRDETPCRFCDFREACHFDPTMKKDKLRFLPVESPARVHEILLDEEERKEGAECPSI